MTGEIETELKLHVGLISISFPAHIDVSIGDSMLSVDCLYLWDYCMEGSNTYPGRWTKFVIRLNTKNEKEIKSLLKQLIEVIGGDKMGLDNVFMTYQNEQTIVKYKDILQLQPTTGRQRMQFIEKYGWELIKDNHNDYPYQYVFDQQSIEEVSKIMKKESRKRLVKETEWKMGLPRVLRKEISSFAEEEYPEIEEEEKYPETEEEEEEKYPETEEEEEEKYPEPEEEKYP